MKAPDKIFFPNDINLMTKLSLVINQKDDVCYIRKDVLLEWARKEIELSKAVECVSEVAYEEGRQQVAQNLIDKLNSI